MDPRPPRLAAWLAGCRVARDDREFAIGDLQEEFADRVARDGPARARRWYWRQTILSCLTPRPRQFDYVPAQSRRPLMEHLIHDVQFALRLLRRSPGFAAVVILTLGLGIGATTTIFSVVHAALLKPLPFRHSDRLVTALNGTGPTDETNLSYPQLLQWRDSSAFEQLVGYFNWEATTTGTEEAELLSGKRLTEQIAPASLRFMSTVALLKPGQTAAVAQAQLQAAALRAAPDQRPEPRVVVFPLRDRIVMNSRSVLLALSGAVGFLLLITCANLANLLLARASGRRHEIAVRLAVGAGRGRVVTQLLTESVVLSAVGGAAGLLVAWAAVRAVASLPTLAAAGVYELSLNWTVLAFAAALSVASGVLFGLMPALQARHASLTVDLREGTRTSGGGDRLRRVFVVASR